MKMLDKIREEGIEVDSYTLSTGQVVYSIGKPNIKKLVKKALAEFS